MRNKLTIIGAFILSLIIAGSAFAVTGGTTTKAGLNAKPTAVKTNPKPKKKKHRKAKKAKAVKTESKKKT